jgi:hypothetical protein
MAERVRHQVFLPKALSERLETLAAAPGACKSSILADAVQAWLTRKGESELDQRYALRLDRMTAALGRIERDLHIMAETLALFVRYELTIHPPLADSDQAGRALGRQRFEAFVEQVGRAVAGGGRTLAPDRERDR